MTKAEHKARAAQMAWQVRLCYSKPAKRLMVSECLKHLLESLKVS